MRCVTSVRLRDDGRAIDEQHRDASPVQREHARRSVRACAPYHHRAYSPTVGCLASHGAHPCTARVIDSPARIIGKNRRLRRGKSLLCRLVEQKFSPEKETVREEGDLFYSYAARISICRDRISILARKRCYSAHYYNAFLSQGDEWTYIIILHATRRVSRRYTVSRNSYRQF